MLKRYNQLFLSLRVLLDLAIVAVAFVGAWNIRFGSPKTLPYTELPSPQDSLFVFAMALVIWPLCLRQSGLYLPQRQRSLVDEVFSVVRACGIAGILLVVATVFTREARYSRGMLVIFTGLSAVGVGLVRLLFKQTLQLMRARGYNRRFVLVLGAGRLARQTLEAIEAHKELGFHPVGCLSVTQKKVGAMLGPTEVIGTLRDLPKVLEAQAIDMVLVALPSRSVHQLPRVMRVLGDTTIDVKLVPDVYQYATLFGGLEEFGGLPIVNLQSTGVLGMHAISKRLFDLLLGALFVVLLSPLFAVLALSVKLSSRGPVFFRQTRVGLDGRPFQMLKFRTMRSDAEASGPQFTQARDPRTTAIGGLLRKLSLDELPQLFNVLWGDMSLVGPRPEQQVFIERFRRRIPRYHLRHMVKSGMTGWAQINGLRGDTSIEKRVEYDLYYIEHWSLLFDLKILARTVAGGFLSRNAY